MPKGESSLFVKGQVEYVEGGDSIQYNDTAYAGRIKVRLDSDGKNISTEDLPYAFPLLPKVFQSIPKIGEGVFVINAKINTPDSQRYYVGPIISQPQFQDYCSYDNGNGDAVSLLSTSKALRNDPLTSIDRASSLTKGAFPSPKDVAIIGRGEEDIILKYRGNRDGEYSETSEIDLRAGIRLQPADTTIKYLKGNVVFNTVNPGYIQIKYKQNGIAGLSEGEGDNDNNKYESPSKREANSIINVVADKINLISHKDSNQFGESITNNEQLVLEEQMDNIMSKLHKSVYGDELVSLLQLIVKAICEHTHPYSMLPPTINGTTLSDIIGYNYEQILSNNVRIS
jgi:hypothetical protein